MKANLLFGNDVITATWQKKKFRNTTVAWNFIRKHRDNHGINGTIVGVLTMTRFGIVDLLKRGV